MKRLMTRIVLSKFVWDPHKRELTIEDWKVGHLLEDLQKIKVVGKYRVVTFVKYYHEWHEGEQTNCWSFRPRPDCYEADRDIKMYVLTR